MRTCDVETGGEVWAYRPASHKTEHHNKRRVIYLGPRAQEVLQPWLRTDRGACLFQPREAAAERRAEMRARRKTRVQPSQFDRRTDDPQRAPGSRYTVNSYRQAIVRGCDRAGVPHWHPNQLRHNAATAIRKQFGLDAARAILGHSTAVVTEVYAELDAGQAAAVMARVG